MLTPLKEVSNISSQQTKLGRSSRRQLGCILNCFIILFPNLAIVSKDHFNNSNITTY